MNSITEALIEWTKARKAIFEYDGLAPKPLWDRLGAAEKALMDWGRTLEKAYGKVDLSTPSTSPSA